MSVLIGLTGYAGAGKDEAAKALIADGFERVAFADAVRDALLALNPFVYVTSWDRIDMDTDQANVPMNRVLLEHGDGFDFLGSVVKGLGWEAAKKIYDVRRLLQRMGTEAGREIHGQDCWVAIAERKIRAAIHEGKSVVVTDVRFPNEAALIHSLGGRVYRVVRPGVGPRNAHVSETAIDDAQVDGTIDNDGTLQDLHARVRQIVR